MIFQQFSTQDLQQPQDGEVKRGSRKASGKFQVGSTPHPRFSQQRHGLQAGTLQEMSQGSFAEHNFKPPVEKALQI